LVAQISALQELSDVLSWHSVFQVMGPSSTTHSSEFKEGKLNSISYRITNLRPPTCIAIGGELMVMIRFWRKGVCVRFCIRGMREVHVCMKQSRLGGCKFVYHS
jgi:hypothetical protein